MTPVKNESPLSRWSRRKLEVQENAGNELPAVVVDENSGLSSDAEIETEAVVVLTDADMPDIESLTEESDFSDFMSSGVSDKLRNLALRKLFNSAIFNVRDGLDDYDEDYTYFEKLGDIVTCDMKHQIEMEEKERLEALEKENEADEANVEDIEGGENDVEAAADEEVTAIENEQDQLAEQPGDIQESDDNVTTQAAKHDEK